MYDLKQEAVILYLSARSTELIGLQYIILFYSHRFREIWILHKWSPGF